MAEGLSSHMKRPWIIGAAVALVAAAGVGDGGCVPRAGRARGARGGVREAAPAALRSRRGDHGEVRQPRRPSRARASRATPTRAQVMKTSHWRVARRGGRRSRGGPARPASGRRTSSTTSASRRRATSKSCMKCHVGYGWADDVVRLREGRERRLPRLPRAHEHVREGDLRPPDAGDEPPRRGALRGNAAARELPRLPRVRRRRSGGEARRSRLVARAPARGGGRPHRPPRVPLRRLPHGEGARDPRPRLLRQRRGLARRRLRRLPHAPRAPGRADQRPPRRRSPARPATSRPSPGRCPRRRSGTGARRATRTRKDDPHHYLKIKGEFTYEQDAVPEYRWFNGTVGRYLLGDKIDDPEKPTVLNPPLGGIEDGKARIWPFKVHRAKQPYDAGNRYLFPPVTGGKDGYWTNFDWDQAFRLGAKASNIAYSGRYGFARTEMYWPLSHMVAPKEKALCVHRLPRRAVAPRLEGARLRGRSHQDRRPSMSRPTLLLLVAVAARRARGARAAAGEPHPPRLRAARRLRASGPERRRSSRPTKTCGACHDVALHLGAQRPRRAEGEGELRPVPPRRRAARRAARAPRAGRAAAARGDPDRRAPRRELRGLPRRRLRRRTARWSSPPTSRRLPDAGGRAHLVADAG